jgi:tetratricopeptide (TPR) repeat protein
MMVVEEMGPKRSSPGEATRPRWWVVPAFLAGGAAALAIVVLGPRWLGPPAEPVEKTEEEKAPDSLSGPAFSPQATVGDFKQEATRAIDELVQAFPDRHDVLNLLGWLQNNQGHSTEAVKTWQRCLELDPAFADAVLCIAVVAKEQGDLGKAAGLFRRGMELAPNDPNAPSLLADVLVAQGQTQQAVELLEASLRAGNRSLSALSCLGHAYLQLQQYEKARAALEQIVAIAPNEKNAWYGLARACARLGDQARAAESMARFKTLSAETQKKETGRIKAQDDLAEMRRIATDAHHEAAKLYLKHGRPEKAEQMWRRAAALGPKHAESRLALALFCERTNRQEEALRLCREVCDLHPSRADYWFYAAILNARLGRAGDARAAAEKALQLDPQNPKYREAYEAILKTVRR